MSSFLYQLKVFTLMETIDEHIYFKLLQLGELNMSAYLVLIALLHAL